MGHQQPLRPGAVCGGRAGGAPPGGPRDPGLGAEGPRPRTGPSCRQQDGGAAGGGGVRGVPRVGVSRDGGDLRVARRQRPRAARSVEVAFEHGGWCHTLLDTAGLRRARRSASRWSRRRPPAPWTRSSGPTCRCACWTRRRCRVPRTGRSSAGVGGRAGAGVCAQQVGPGRPEGPPQDPARVRAGAVGASGGGTGGDLGDLREVSGVGPPRGGRPCAPGRDPVVLDGGADAR